MKWRYFCLSLGIFAVTAFGITALALGQIDVALEVAKVTGCAALGYIEGIGKAKWDASSR